MPMSEDIRIALEVQQKAYRDLIDVVRSTFNDRIKQLEANHNELTASLQFTQREVDDLKKTSTEKDEEINRMKKEIAELKNRKYEEEMEVIKKKLNYQEDYSRRNNIRIDGLEDDPKRKAQLPELRKARADGKIAYFSYTKLVVRERRERTGPISVSTDSRLATALPAPAPAAGIFAPSASAVVTLGEYLTAAGGSGVGAVGGHGLEREERPRRTAAKKK
ncbi:hypothetical protein Pmani_006792 [Petrolisthes manimaculis]|uniref:Uncharacterized protein n=1 Tax=Petrolisthes manimaculis TaxID=1843537 RepID=A0AAE1QC59_9EUCA|nr:hypothetical protein Pmani_006792 [Petrolisthes manimaculis]